MTSETTTDFKISWTVKVIKALWKWSSGFTGKYFPLFRQNNYTRTYCSWKNLVCVWLLAYFLLRFYTYMFHLTLNPLQSIVRSLFAFPCPWHNYLYVGSFCFGLFIQCICTVNWAYSIICFCQKTERRERIKCLVVRWCEGCLEITWRT